MLSTTSTFTHAFTEPASNEQIERTALALEANGIHTLIAENGEQARKLFFELVNQVLICFKLGLSFAGASKKFFRLWCGLRGVLCRIAHGAVKREV